MPIIRPVMAAEARGASRNGRYATRSTIMPTKAVKNMDIRIVRTRISHPGNRAAPLVPTRASRAVATPRPM